MFTRFIFSLLLASSSLILMPLASARSIRLLVPSYDYTPGHAEATLGAGISNNETIVGIYVFHGQDVGYLITPDHRFGPSIAVPGALYTIANGVNDAGLVCGNYFPGDTEHGFLYDGSTYTTFDIPDAIYTHVTGVNDAGGLCWVCAGRLRKHHSIHERRRCGHFFYDTGTKRGISSGD